MNTVTVETKVTLTIKGEKVEVTKEEAMALAKAINEAFPVTRAVAEGCAKHIRDAIGKKPSPPFSAPLREQWPDMVNPRTGRPYDILANFPDGVGPVYFG